MRCVKKRGREKEKKYCSDLWLKHWYRVNRDSCRLFSNLHIRVQINTFDSWPSEDVFSQRLLLFSGKELLHILEHAHSQMLRPPSRPHHLLFFSSCVKQTYHGWQSAHSPAPHLFTELFRGMQTEGAWNKNKVAPTESICFINSGITSWIIAWACSSAGGRVVVVHILTHKTNVDPYPIQLLNQPLYPTVSITTENKLPSFSLPKPGSKRAWRKFSLWRFHVIYLFSSHASGQDFTWS